MLDLRLQLRSIGRQTRQLTNCAVCGRSFCISAGNKLFAFEAGVSADRYWFLVLDTP